MSRYESASHVFYRNFRGSLRNSGECCLRAFLLTSWPTPDLINCESIPERNRLHDGEIKTHRHGDLALLLYVQAGQTQVVVEDAERRVGGGTLQIVPVMYIHGCRFPKTSRAMSSAWQSRSSTASPLR